MVMMMMMGQGKRIDIVCRGSSSFIIIIKWIDRSIEDRQDVIFLCAFCFHVLRAVIACVC